MKLINLIMLVCLAPLSSGVKTRQKRKREVSSRSSSSSSSCEVIDWSSYNYTSIFVGGIGSAPGFIEETTTGRTAANYTLTFESKGCGNYIARDVNPDPSPVGLNPEEMPCVGLLSLNEFNSETPFTASSSLTCSSKLGTTTFEVLTVSEDCEALEVQSVFVSADGSEGVYRAILGASTIEVTDVEGGRKLQRYPLCESALYSA